MNVNVKIIKEQFERIEEVFDKSETKVIGRKKRIIAVFGNKIDAMIENDCIITNRHAVVHEYIGSYVTEVSMPHHKAVDLVDELSKYYLGKIDHQNGVEWNEMLFEKYLHYRSVYGDLLGLKKPQVAISQP